MRPAAFFILIGLGFFLGMNFQSNETQATAKVDVCHIPPGNPQNAFTVNVGEPSLSAHLGHGDSLGACASSELDPCDLSSNLNNCVSDGIYY